MNIYPITTLESLSGVAVATFDWNSQNLTGVGSITATSLITGTLTVADGSITDSDGAISFGDENLSTTGTLAGLSFNSVYMQIIADHNVSLGDSLTMSSINNGNYNTCIGNRAGQNIDDGSLNVLIGFQAGNKIEGGEDNFCLGLQAGLALVDHSYNVFIGTYVGKGCIGDQNVGIGYGSFRYEGYSEKNTAIGSQALRGQGAITKTVHYCTGVGSQAGYSVDTATHDTFIGSQSGYSLTTGDFNVFIGKSAGYRQTTESNLLIIDRGLAAGTPRASKADEVSNSIIYGVMADTPADQTIRLNAEVIMMANIPAADPTNAGQLWNNGGVLTVSAG